MKQSVHYVLIVCVIMTILIGTPAHAQETATTQSPAGIGILILLMGLAALGLVALSNFARSRPNNGDEDVEDEDEAE